MDWQRKVDGPLLDVSGKLQAAFNLPLNAFHLRRGGRVAECGGLLNMPRSYRFNLLNNLQMGAKVLKRGALISVGHFAPQISTFNTRLLPPLLRQAAPVSAPTTWIGGRCWNFPGAQIDTGSWEAEWRNDGKMRLRDDTGAVIEGVEVDAPEDADALPVLSSEERRLREVNLARLMLVIADIVLAGDPLGLETARDLVREARHACPEIVDESL